MEYAPLLRRLIAGEHLTQAESARTDRRDHGRRVYDRCKARACWWRLRCKGEHVDEIVGAARAMRERSLHVDARSRRWSSTSSARAATAPTRSTFPRMAALVVAAAGVPVAKHGNRAASSACGSADVLEATGLPIDVAPERAAAMLREAAASRSCSRRATIPAMKNVAPIRRELGVRTDFQRARPAHESGARDASRSSA